jgi:hypothetical protein
MLETDQEEVAPSHSREQFKDIIEEVVPMRRSSRDRLQDFVTYTYPNFFFPMIIFQCTIEYI